MPLLVLVSLGYGRSVGKHVQCIKFVYSRQKSKVEDSLHLLTSTPLAIHCSAYVSNSGQAQD